MIHYNSPTEQKGTYELMLEMSSCSQN